ncbi:MAG: Two-component system sensor histidine kinase/response regulator hybrid [uncultured Chloroflexi bacterium]|uniref:histidine kinase n=1 Tax=uncultured Chloroflexota bacterium TaxID=166587 RepID=A0A6J4HS72_9CHLR|nr:MAG: Two-component system sensor histidine kinase/response regulator hybrid [uncultured Chloroflexota bacterium]
MPAELLQGATSATGPTPGTPALRPTAAEPPLVGPAKILIVDDEPKNLLALEAVLDLDHLELVRATSGSEALKALLNHEFAAVLLDVQMPGMDGFETATLIRQRERTRDVPIIFLTAASRSEAFVSRGYSVGAVDYLVKPFDPVILRHKVAVFVDLFRKTEQVRRQAEERAQLLEERLARVEAEAARDRLQQVIDVLPEGIALADEHGAFHLWNRTAEEILGQPPAAVQTGAAGGLPLLDLNGEPCPPEELPLARAILWGDTVRGVQLLVENTAAGRRVPVLVNSAPLRGAAGVISGGVLAFQDISAIKEVEEQKDIFLAAASHDLKNPLAVLKSRAQLLHRRLSRPGATPDVPSILKGLQGIDDTAGRLTEMINELLDVTRIQMGRPLDLDLRPMDLLELAREVALELRESTDRHEIKVEASCDSLEGEWDRQRLGRVLANLVSNAVKYSPDGGPITLKLSREQEGTASWAVLSVTDSGIGIPQEDLPRVFDRYFRARNVSRRIEGTGIGLAGARHIVEEHGGQIMLESSEGLGTTVTIKLLLTAVGDITVCA